MAEDNIVVKTIEDVDKLFSQIVVNGEVFDSERYVEPEPKPVVVKKALVKKAEVTRSTVQTEPQNTTRSENTRSIQGENVYAVELNDILHNFEDRAIVQALSEEAQTRAGADEHLQQSITDINSKIPSTASSSNKLADNASVGTSIDNAIGALDVASAGGNGKYIKSISETDGKISAVTGNIDSSVNEGSSNPVTGGAVHSAIQAGGADAQEAIDSAIATEVENRNSAISSAISTEVSNRNTAISNAIAEEVSNRNTAILNAVEALDVASAGGNGKYIKAISETDGKISATTGNIDSSVTAGSSNPVTGGAVDTAINVVKASVEDIEALIPNQATEQNQLADKAFVNSSITSNTANFLGTYTSLAQIQAIPNPTNNDYAFLQTTDSAGNTEYQRYKYSSSDSQWHYEYTLNNSSFTAEQWATINSGLTQESVTAEIGEAISGEVTARNSAISSAISTEVSNRNTAISNAIDTEVSNRNTAISNAVEALDVASAGGNGKYIKSISETDGKISATTGDIDSSVTAGSSNPVTGGAVATALSGKVDKVTGKGLSTNDFTNALKNKLNGIEAGAQVNSVTGVKGSAETDYRTGDISISKGDIGLGNVVNTGDSAVPSENGTEKFTTGGAYTELNRKADKVSGATNNDVAILDADGNLKDSGIRITNIKESTRYHFDASSSSAPLDKVVCKIETDSTSKGRALVEIDVASRIDNVSVGAFKVIIVVGYSLTPRMFVLGSPAPAYCYFRLTKSDVGQYTWYVEYYQEQGSNRAVSLDITVNSISNLCTVTKYNFEAQTDTVTSFLDTRDNRVIVENELNLKADLSDLAPAFSASTSYAVGDYVTCNGNLYRCTVAHSGAWSSSDFTLVTVGSDLALKADKTSLAVPSDAVLHYSFDEVPDYPDGTAVYFRNKNFTSADNWRCASGTVEYINGVVSITITGTDTYLYRNVNFSNCVVKIKLKTSVTEQMVLFATGSSDSLTFESKANQEQELIFYFSGTCTAIGLSNVAQGNIVEILQIYIGDGSYSTPIIDNANGQNNATNNSGIATKGVSGKGVRTTDKANIILDKQWVLPDKRTISLWVNLPNTNGWGSSKRLWRLNLAEYCNAGESAKTLSFRTQNADSKIMQADINVSNYVGKWCHIVVITELTATSGNKKVYVNGEKLADVTSNYDHRGITSNEPWNLFAFSYINNSAIDGAEYDDLLIFDRALSETEVQALYQNKANTSKYYTKADMLEAELTEELDTKQPKTLDTPVTVGGIQQATVEGALGALAQASATPSVETGTVITSMGSVPQGYLDCSKRMIEKFVPNGSSLFTNNSVVSLLQTADGAVYAGGIGLCKSTDRRIFTRLSSIPANYGIYALLQTADGAVYAGSIIGLYKSTDGSTFTLLSGFPNGYMIRTLLQTTDGTIYVGTDSHGIYKSTDGNTFTQLSGFPTNASVRALLQTADGAVYAGTYENGLYKSTDGSTFTQLSGFPTSSFVITLLQTADGAIYAGTHSNQGIYKSTDGSTFTQLSGFPASYDADIILQTTDGTIYVGTGIRGLYKSIDGSTFTQLSGFPTNSYIIALLQTADGAIYAGTESGSNLRKSVPFRELSKTAYADLYAVVGDKFNAEAGVTDATKFAIPLVGNDKLTYMVKV